MRVKSSQLAKLTRPRLHRPVRRERLFRLLDKRIRKPVVWVSGPPGAGKSTLVASYLESRKLETWWLQVDEGDLDPAAFFYYLNALARRIAPRKRAALPYLTQEYLADLAGFARRYFRSFFALLTGQAVLVLDNCQDAASESFHEILRAASTELPDAVTLILISRAHLPDELVRAKTAGSVLLLGREELRLNAKEAVAIGASSERSPEEVEALNAQVNGWVAGLVLLLAEPRRSTTTASLSGSYEELFTYFAGEVLSRASADARTLLLKTSVLPQVTVSMAQALTGNAQAAKVLDWLYRRQYFTERKVEIELTYQYHDLFREFLLARFASELSAPEQHDARQRAAQLLIGQGKLTEAVELFRATEDWASIGEVVKQHAAQVFETGRWRTLQEWVSGVPQAMLEQDPWFMFWHAVAISPTNYQSACTALERCYELFQQQGSPVGQFIVANTIADIAYGSGDGIEPTYRWALIMAELMPRVTETLTPENLLRGWRVIVLAFAGRFLDHPLVDEGAGILEDRLFNTKLSDYDTLLTGGVLAAYCWPLANIELFDKVCARVDPIARSAQISPIARGMWHAWRSVVMQTIPRLDESDRDDQVLLDLGKEYRLDGLQAYALNAQVSRYRLVGQFAEAEMHLQALRDLAAKSRLPFVHFALTQQELMLHIRRGDLTRAGGFVREIEASIEQVGYGPPMAYLRLAIIDYLVQVGRIEEAAKRLQIEHGVAAKLRVNMTEAQRLATQAYLEYARGNTDQAMVTFSLALDAAEKPGRGCYIAVVGKLNVLCALALRSDQNVERVRKFVRQFQLVPLDPHEEHWPWPLQLEVLGRPKILANGESVTFGRKPPRRPLSLLYALVCAGPDGLSHDQLADSLWADLDRDAAEAAIKMAISRLREILRNVDAVQVKHTQVRLNRASIWVDAWAFEELAKRAAKIDDEALRERAIQAFKGELLEAETLVPWVIVARERLRSLFLKLIDVHGAWLENNRRFTEAIDVYERGIQAENLAETCYRALMRCHLALNQRAQATAVFRRLRLTLATTLGTTPSSATLEMLERLGDI